MRCALEGGDVGQPATDDCFPLGQVGLPVAREGEEAEGQIVEGVAACPHPGFQLSVADGSVRGGGYFRRVDGKHGAYIGVYDQSGQGTEDKVAVVQLLVAAPLGMGDGDDAVKVGERLRGRLE